MGYSTPFLGKSTYPKLSMLLSNEVIVGLKKAVFGCVILKNFYVSISCIHLVC